MADLTPLNELDILKNHKKYDKQIVLDLMQKIMNDPEPAKNYSEEILEEAAKIIRDSSIKSGDDAIKAINQLIS